ncbi:MAG: hypothetical protein H8K10_15600 [Nitrospira sp.]|nr:hypothetical protein [Nitrospira sp.]
MTDTMTLPLDRSQQERKVMTLLTERQGRQAAIGKSELAKITGMPEREVRRVIKHLIEEHGEPIGSTSGEPHGYYLICTADEQAHAENELRHRIIELARRLGCLKRNQPAEVLGQIVLELQ